ncbi:MAG: hypothetical protein RLN88_11955 [Ekhidna sp.]|uniref:hypothetical protein n=1 Tax=Ekhidna sp. TaxID=2608089 RepID=UPI0032EF9F62
MKKKIVIASVLKPIDDVRSYWKLSQSILKTNKYDLNIIGNIGKKAIDDIKVTFHTHSLNRTNWAKRLIIREKILLKILRINPDILIVTSHELLNISLIAKLTTGCKVVYDVQEDYYKNLRFIDTSPLRNIYSLMVRLKEQISRLYVTTYWLAEKCYAEEIRFIKGKFVVIENKAFNHQVPVRSFEQINMLFSGSVSDYSAARNAIHLFEKLKGQQSDIRLKIIGQVHDSKLEKWLFEKQKEHPEIELQISQEAISYPEILEAISTANLGVIGYEPNEVNRRKIPTKLYEYSRYKLPYVVATNSYWEEVGGSLGGAIPIDFANPGIEKMVENWKNSPELFQERYPTEATWESESEKLVQSLEKLSKA